MPILQSWEMLANRIPSNPLDAEHWKIQRQMRRSPAFQETKITLSNSYTGWAVLRAP